MSEEKLKKATLPVFIEILETLAEQGFIDVGPRERGYDLTPIYDFLVEVGIADAIFYEYWLKLVNEDACLALTKILKESQPDVLGEPEQNQETNY